jgi:hypothetical protein
MSQLARPAGAFPQAVERKRWEKECFAMNWEVLIPVGIVVGWVVLNRWILPKMGIST